MPPFEPQAGQHERALAVFEDLRAVGLSPDQESFAVAAEACSADASHSGARGDMGDRALQLLRLARAHGLRPGAKAVAASLAACVGGGPWRRAIPTIDKMLATSTGGQSWDDVMNFLTKARQESLDGQRSGAKREEKAVGGVRGIAGQQVGGVTTTAGRLLPLSGGNGDDGVVVMTPHLSTPKEEEEDLINEWQHGEFNGISAAASSGGGGISVESISASGEGSVATVNGAAVNRVLATAVGLADPADALLSCADSGAGGPPQAPAPSMPNTSVLGREQQPPVQSRHADASSSGSLNARICRAERESGAAKAKAKPKAVTAAKAIAAAAAAAVRLDCAPALAHAVIAAAAFCAVRAA